MNVSVERGLSRVWIEKAAGGFVLMRGDQPFYVRGACGFENLDRLKALGANAVRTWGYNQTYPIINAMQRLDLALCAGLWMEPGRRGFDYSDSKLVRRQEDRIMQEVDALKSERSLLCWAIGNELDLENRCDSVWDAVERLARRIKEVDGNHPVITVIASPRESTLRALEERCPSLDAIGINSYGDISKVVPALDSFGYDLPYFVTEWGPSGSWEVSRTPWGAALEPSSSEKASQYAERMRMIEGDTKRCVGHFAFFWGNKQETTPTWFNLYDKERHEFESVRVLESFWKGSSDWSAPICIHEFTLDDREDYAVLEVGQICEARFRADLVETVSRVSWTVRKEQDVGYVGGDSELDLAVHELSLVSNAEESIRFKVSWDPGAYRLYLEVHDGFNNVASANIPFKVE